MTTLNFIEPGCIYPTIDDAMHAASCMCGQHPAGATIYGTTEGPDPDPDTGEAYIVVCQVDRVDGQTWRTIPPAPYEPIYTITRVKGR